MRWFMIDEHNNLIKYAGLGKKSITYYIEQGYYPFEDDSVPETYLIYDPDGFIRELTSLEKKTKALEDEYKLYTEMYTMNPDLATRVREYKYLLDVVDCKYDPVSISVNNFTQKVLVSENVAPDEKAAYFMRAQSLWLQGVVFNLSCLNIQNADVFAWENFSKLVNYLPTE